MLHKKRKKNTWNNGIFFHFKYHERFFKIGFTEVFCVLLLNEIKIVICDWTEKILQKSIAKIEIGL